MKNNVHAQIEYLKDDGTKIHSDICPPECDLLKLTKKRREFLHACLDEWLDESKGTGAFWIHQENYLKERFQYGYMDELIKRSFDYANNKYSDIEAEPDREICTYLEQIRYLKKFIGLIFNAQS
jgi:hypothetical protein